MALRKKRLGVGDPAGARSTEWVVLWDSNTADVYVAARLMGATFKASLHASGQCHVRGPDAGQWMAPGPPPRFLSTWTLDPNAATEHSFGIIVPSSELRGGAWDPQKDKGAVWIAAGGPGDATEIGVFFTRVHPSPAAELAAAGWTTTVLVERLADGRDLWVLAANFYLLEARRADLQETKARAPALMAALPQAPARPRLLLFADSGHNPRHFVEAAVDLPPPPGNA